MHPRALLVGCTLLLAGCTSAGAPPRLAGEGEGPQAPTRTLAIAVRTEGETLAAKALTNPGTNVIPASPFNAGLVIKDEGEVPHPYLAVSLPQLNTETWRVFPDGRMETRYQLKGRLVWHDRTPLSAEDFVFAWRLYATPEIGPTATSAPINQIEEVAAPDAQTLVIRWRRPYAEAGELEANDLQALPRHILEGPYEQLSIDALAAHPFWTVEYVGLGPYRVTRWERGVFLEAEAFDGYVRGRPKIDRIKIAPIPDPNTVMANLLAGEVHIAVANSIPEQQGLVLQREWTARGGGGLVLTNPGIIRRTENQLHPDRANPKAVLDLRVRKGFAHAVDKQAINEAVFEGLGLMADTLLPSTVSYFSQVDRALSKYPFDLRRSEQLMNEAGYFRAPDGSYASPTEGRLSWEVKVLSGPQNEAVMAIMADTWRGAGFDITETVFPVAQVRDREVRAQFRTMFTTDGGNPEGMNTAGIPTPQNRWSGSNRGSWSNPEYDRLVAAWESTLDRNERNQRMSEMAKLYSEELGSTPLFHHLNMTPHTTALKGPVDGVRDIHLWEWAR